MNIETELIHRAHSRISKLEAELNKLKICIDKGHEFMHHTAIKEQSSLVYFMCKRCAYTKWKKTSVEGHTGALLETKGGSGMKT